ncbi:MAG: hypothetical protein QNK23_07915 [Crocinitomicaceae bacterium]|nr:hypothetical protein [Crocinitomicaceae bacterium]
MKKTNYFILGIAILLGSCGSDNSTTETSETDSQTTDSLTIDESTETMIYEPYVDENGREYELGPQSDIALLNQHGEDSIFTDEEGIMYFVYPAPDTTWLN